MQISRTKWYQIIYSQDGQMLVQPEDKKVAAAYCKNTSFYLIPYSEKMFWPRYEL